MARLILQGIGSLLMTLAERCYEAAEDHFPVIDRAKALEQRHTKLEVELDKGVVRVRGCGRHLTLVVDRENR